MITQQAPMSARSDSEAVRLALSERGILTAEVIATERGGRDSMNMMYTLVLSTERVGAIMRRVLAFYNAVMEGLDPHKRQQTFYYNVTLEHLSHQTLLRNPQPRSSYPMNMRSGQQPVVAFPEPRIIIRQDLGNPDEEIERVITLLLRNSSA